MIPNRREVAGQVHGRRVAVAGFLGQTPLHSPAQRRRNRAIELGDRLRLVVQDRPEDVDRRSALERALARDHLVEDRPEGELIRPRVECGAARLLRRHVPDRPHDHAGGGPSHRRELRAIAAARARGHQLGEAEVQDLDEPVFRHHDVLGFQVPMHDPRLVSLRQTIGHLDRDRQKPLDRDRSADDLPRSVCPSTFSIAM